MQLNKDKIHINWPFGIRTNVTFDEVTNEVGYYIFYYDFSIYTLLSDHLCDSEYFYQLCDVL